MNSSIISASEILNNAKELISAGFSAGYSFDGINAEEYFDELVESAGLVIPIFSGILIMEKSDDSFTIIDGLQRITTISLLLCALCETYKNTSQKNDEAKNKIFSRYLVNQTEPKLILGNEEHEVYKKILFQQDLNDNEAESNLAKTYLCFVNKIKEHKISGTELFRMVSKIQFMLITINKSEVSIRDLYQALNNYKNKPQINLISDFIYQRGKCEGKYGDKWLEIVNLYKELGSQCLIEDFIRDFLIIQNDGKVPHKNALYNNFKSYFIKISKYLTSEIIVDNICKYAKNYLKIINADFEDNEIKEQIIILNENNGQDSYPYLMEVMDDLENGHINKEVFSDILTMINSFVKNRQENPLSEVAIDFNNLSKELNKMLVLKNYTPKIIDENKLTINEINNLSTFEV